MYKPIIALALFVCLCGISIGYDANTNRPGSDYNSYPLQAENPTVCEQACNNDPQCQAWAYQNYDGMCWLKNAVPAQQSGWDGFFSGVKGQVTSASDLTGTWRGDDGGIYYIRQLGNTIWWDVDGTTGSWGNVAHGTISGNTIRLDYADIPEGNARGYGTLVLNIISSNELQITEKPESYGGSHLQR